MQQQSTHILYVKAAMRGDAHRGQSCGSRGLADVHCAVPIRSPYADARDKFLKYQIGHCFIFHVPMIVMDLIELHQRRLE